MLFGSKVRYSPEGSVAAIIFVFLIGVMLLQVIGRLGYFSPPIWTEELCRWLWVWMAFVGIAEVERTDAHLRMDFIPAMMARGVRLVLFTGIDLAYLAVTCHLIWIGYRGVMRNWNSASVSLPVTDAVLYASFPVAGIFIAFRIAQRLVGRLREPAREGAR